MISEAAKQIEVEDHVLRYWQKQLELPISRNEMEQRYYKEADIEVLKRVKQLKERGFQLKAIKMLLSSTETPEMVDSEMKQLLGENQNGMVQFMKDENQTETDRGTSLMTGEEVSQTPDTKINQLKMVLTHIILEAMKENNEMLTQEISDTVTGRVSQEMNYLMKVQEEKEEERYRKFDAVLRDYQKSRMLSAATLEQRKRKSKFFKKNKVYL
jgi:DNA-binding transcriptional MerR regulator